MVNDGWPETIPCTHSCPGTMVKTPGSYVCTTCGAPSGYTPDEPYDEPVIVLRMRSRPVAFVAAYARWLGYKVRPFDMLADRRRWFWQRPAPCAYLDPRTAALREAIRRIADQ
jgi:hypothetical protein